MRPLALRIPSPSVDRTTVRVTRSKARTLLQYNESRIVQPFHVISTSDHVVWFTAGNSHDSGAALYGIYILWCNRAIVWPVGWNQPNNT